MISQNLLTAKGSIEALIALTNQGSLATAALADEMDVAEGTARERLNALNQAGLVVESAELREDRPVRVYAVTDQGEQLANSLASIIDEYGAGDDDAAASADSHEGTEDITDSDETA